MLENTSYCPASISLIFKSCPNPDLLKMGSVGVGFTIDRGVAVKTKRTKKTQILFNGGKIDFPTVLDVVNNLTKKPVNVSIQTPLPLGYGFGLSAAASLASALSVNKLFNLHKSKRELINLCHITEIKNNTGLGSVGTQITGGFLVKTSPGIYFKAKSLPFNGRKIYAVMIEKLTTPTILSDNIKLNKLNQVAQKQIDKILASSLTLEEIFDISYQFAKESQLLTHPKTVSIIEKIKRSGGHATMTMLGQVVISTVKPSNSDIDGLKVEEMTITKDSIFSRN